MFYEYINNCTISRILVSPPLHFTVTTRTDQADPCNLLDPSMESDTDLDYMEMFTSNLLAEDDKHNSNDTITLARGNHSLNTPPLVDLSDDTEPHHQVVDLFGDIEPGDQEAAQELAAPGRHLHPHHHLHCLQSIHCVMSRYRISSSCKPINTI